VFGGRAVKLSSAAVTRSTRFDVLVVGGLSRLRVGRASENGRRVCVVEAGPDYASMSSGQRPSAYGPIASGARGLSEFRRTEPRESGFIAKTAPRPTRSRTCDKQPVASSILSPRARSVELSTAAAASTGSTGSTSPTPRSCRPFLERTRTSRRSRWPSDWRKASMGLQHPEMPSRSALSGAGGPASRRRRPSRSFLRRRSKVPQVSARRRTAASSPARSWPSGS
jgi:hypothetical protein